MNSAQPGNPSTLRPIVTKKNKKTRRSGDIAHPASVCSVCAAAGCCLLPVPLRCTHTIPTTTTPPPTQPSLGLGPVKLSSQSQTVSALSSLGRGDGGDADCCWMTLLDLTCEFSQLIAARSRFQSQGECAAVLELRALLGFPRVISSEGTPDHGHAHGEAMLCGT